MPGKSASFAVVGLAAIALLAGAMWFQKNETETFCGFCHRPIHAETRVIAEVGGQRKTVCCARCAITESMQEDRPVRLLEVTDYASGRSVKPEQAYFVDGSRKVLCDHDAPLFDESKHVHPLAFDRCFPGTYAFARREDAAAFARENGGVVVRLQDLMRGVNSQ